MAHTANLLEVFEGFARAAGAQVLVAADGNEAASAIAALATAGNSPVRCTALVRESYPDICRAMEAAAVEVSAPEIAEETAPDRSTLAASLAGGTGVVLARAGVAETGSVVLADDSLSARLVSMLSDVCVALLPASAVVPGLDEAASLLAELERAGHRYISMVTGPSRTADIERELTIGVQGPKALHIIVLPG